jgi:hypothetical protein
LKYAAFAKVMAIFRNVKYSSDMVTELKFSLGFGLLEKSNQKFELRI